MRAHLAFPGWCGEVAERLGVPHAVQHPLPVYMAPHQASVFASLLKNRAGVERRSKGTEGMDQGDLRRLEELLDLAVAGGESLRPSHVGHRHHLLAPTRCPA